MSNDYKFADSIITAAKQSGKVIGATAIFDAASAAIIPVVGFTTEGVATSSVAAAIQSSIGAVKTGSLFAHLQSVGALGQGLLGAAGLPVLVGVTVGGAIVYVVYKSQEEEIDSFLLKNKEKVESMMKKLDQNFMVTKTLSDTKEQISEDSKEFFETSKKLAKLIPSILKNLIKPKL